MWFIIGAAVLAFFLGAGLVLGIFFLITNQKESTQQSLGGLAWVFFALYAVAGAIVVGLVCAILTVIGLMLSPQYQPIYLRCLLVVLCVLLLVFGLASLVRWFRQMAAEREEYRDAERRERALAEEEAFLTVYAKYVDAIRNGDIARTRELVEDGMPFLDFRRKGKRFDPRWSRIVFLLRRQDDPQNPLYVFTPLELAAHTGNPEIVRLLIEYEANDVERNYWHTKAIGAAETARESAYAELHPRYDEVIMLLKQSMNAL